jgi:microcystin-dependent protein
MKLRVLPLLALALAAQPARAALDPFLGELQLFGFNFCPEGFLPADGRLLSISPNTALFSLLGTFYGGDGKSTFALPDLRGRSAIGVGQGPGLSDRFQGEEGGSETVTLTLSEMPAHTHPAGATTLPANTSSPQGSLPARKARTQLYRSGAANTALAPDAIGIAGGSQPHENMPPYLAMTWCIAVQGVYPQRP